MAGYSMGGNLVLKLAGELGEQAPEWLLAAVGVSPAIDLAASADALHEASNRMYERIFCAISCGGSSARVELFPEIYSMDGLGPIPDNPGIRRQDHGSLQRLCRSGRLL